MLPKLTANDFKPLKGSQIKDKKWKVCTTFAM